MRSYTGEITKEMFVAETKRHAQLDHFLKGTYSEGVKGCAVGCAIKSINRLLKKKLRCDEHQQLENYSICPEWLARVQDTLFEGVSLERSKTWPVEFAEAINTGAYLNRIKVPFIVFILENNIKTQQKNLGKGIDDVVDRVIKVNKQMIDAQLSGDTLLIEEAQSAARSAWSAAGSAAWSAARSAAQAAAQSAAWSVAQSAAQAAAQSAAQSVAWSVAWSAQSAAQSVAETESYEKYADELLRLMRECK